jgi:hypothetical protein
MVFAYLSPPPPLTVQNLVCGAQNPLRIPTSSCHIQYPSNTFVTLAWIGVALSWFSFGTLDHGAFTGACTSVSMATSLQLIVDV